LRCPGLSPEGDVLFGGLALPSLFDANAGLSARVFVVHVNRFGFIKLDYGAE
jgi:hypothetical protein